MSLLNRTSSGLLILDTFASLQLNPMWQISPSDDKRYSLSERAGYLRLKHGNPDLFCLMTCPQYDFVFEIDTDYDPVRASDMGGIVAYRDNETRIELLEYYDPDTGTAKGYNRQRMVRVGDLLSAYGSDDSGKTWELIGTSFMSAPKIGMVLHGIQESQSDTLDISEVRMYRKTSIQVGNIKEGLTAKLLTSAGALVQQVTCEKDRDYVDIDVTNLSFPYTGKIQIINTNNTVLAETEVMNDIWGGDVYLYGIHLDMEIDGVTLRPDREYQLGNMDEGVIEKMAYIINNHDEPIPSVRLTIHAYSEYHGWEWVDVAQNVFGTPGNYQDTIYLDTIHPNDRIPFWLKITRRTGATVASLNDYKFIIMCESGD